MRSLHAISISAAAFLSLLSESATADQPISLELSVGAEYDTNISVPDADLIAGTGDFAGLFGAKFDVKPLSGKWGSVNLGYSFDQSIYADSEQFNLQTHTLSGGGDFKLGDGTVGANYSYYHIRLGGDDFLNMHVISPSASRFLSKQVFARAYYTFYDKNFTTLSNRDATAHHAGLSVYRFFDNPKGYVSIGARFESEDAVDPALDFNGYEVTGNLQLPVSVLSDGSRLNFGASYRERDFDSVTPSIGAVRSEDRLRLRGRFETPLTEQIELQFQYRYTDRNSNFPAANFVEHLTTTTLTYKF